MTENGNDLSEYLPGLEPPTSRSVVSAAYEKAILRLRSDGVIGDEHAGICASILTLAGIADNPMTKAYARNGALQDAHEQMKTLLDAAARQGDTDYAAFEAWMTEREHDK
ncbi:hypothetical protein [Microbacterium oxydans]|uniref:hypothetical protein n=1 Tax=Microbacterium oxydans TaxID=82380 RepID=UPI0022B160DF|nr:hypothetical protein [Microbacterium oxydans]MCZ4300766.1 hypothetical protein [Microbacterium oxydans]